MTSEQKDRIRLIAKNRVKEKRNEGKEIDDILRDINLTIEKCPDLSLRERDFAFRYAIEYRTQSKWAEFYGCHLHTIENMMRNPKVRCLIADIQFDIRKYTIGMQTLLLREAMDQYLRIFRAPELTESLEAKRKSADKIMEWFGFGGGKEGEDDKKRVNVNIFTAKEHRRSREENEVVSDAEVLDVDIEDVEQELEDFRKLKDLKTQVEKYIETEGEEDAKDND